MITLAVADDHEVLRQALCEMLERDCNHKVIAQASNGVELLECIHGNKPDVVIMDIEMPEMDGISVLESLKKENFQVPILVLSANDNKRSINSALKAGARGFVPKSVSSQELQFAIQAILNGKTYLSPSVTEVMMDNSNDSESILEVLTKREVEILTFLALGKPNREIGKLLHISTRTVDTHRSNLLKKLNLKTNAELVRVAATAGLIDI